MTIASQITLIKTKIEKAAIAAGRDANDIRLLAASKRTDVNGIRQSIAAGQFLFGENRAQSLRDKHDELATEFPEAEWHFIGHLQKNKIKYVCGRASLIHTVDGFDLANACQQFLTRKAGVPIGVLIQVKLGNEPNKTGCAKEEVMKLCEHVMNLPSLRLEGLMNIPPQFDEPERWFTEIAEIAEQGRQEGFPLHTLSMGMSSDMEKAIACGATIIRIGSMIYNPDWQPS